MTGEIEVSIVIPCLNEERTIRACVEVACEFLHSRSITGEIIVSDNRSTDRSREIAEQCGARVVTVERRGYGAALNGGIRSARGRFLIMADGDGSYDLSRLDPFLEKLRSGCDVVMGNRFRGQIENGAMPPLHRYLGNPVLSFIGRLCVRTSVGDFHCGLRAFSREAWERMDLKSQGMEWASEMVIKTALLGLRTSEVPICLRRDGRGYRSHLRPLRDGLRHLLLMLLFAPPARLLYPAIGMLMAGLGAFVVALWPSLAPGDGAVQPGLLIVVLLVVMTALQLLFMLGWARQFGERYGFSPDHQHLLPRYERMPAGAMSGVFAVLAVSALVRLYDGGLHEELLPGTLTGTSIAIIGGLILMIQFAVSRVVLQMIGSGALE